MSFIEQRNKYRLIDLDFKTFWSFNDFSSEITLWREFASNKMKVFNQSNRLDGFHVSCPKIVEFNFKYTISQYHTSTKTFKDLRYMIYDQSS